jgi:hypothetical protein
VFDSRNRLGMLAGHGLLVGVAGFGTPPRYDRDA